MEIGQYCTCATGEGFDGEHFKKILWIHALYINWERIWHELAVATSRKKHTCRDPGVAANLRADSLARARVIGGKIRVVRFFSFSLSRQPPSHATSPLNARTLWHWDGRQKRILKRNYVCQKANEDWTRWIPKGIEISFSCNMINILPSFFPGPHTSRLILKNYTNSHPTDSTYTEQLASGYVALFSCFSIFTLTCLYFDPFQTRNQLITLPVASGVVQLHPLITAAPTTRLL